MILPVLAAYPLSTARAEAPEGDSGGQAKHEDLAVKLQNPIADLIGVPLQSNFDFGIEQEGRFVTP